MKKGMSSSSSFIYHCWWFFLLQIIPKVSIVSPATASTFLPIKSNLITTSVDNENAVAYIKDRLKYISTVAYYNDFPTYSYHFIRSSLIHASYEPINWIFQQISRDSQLISRFEFWAILDKLLDEFDAFDMEFFVQFIDQTFLELEQQQQQQQLKLGNINQSASCEEEEDLFLSIQVNSLLKAIDSRYPPEILKSFLLGISSQLPYEESTKTRRFLLNRFLSAFKPVVSDLNCRPFLPTLLVFLEELGSVQFFNCLIETYSIFPQEVPDWLLLSPILCALYQFKSHELDLQNGSDNINLIFPDFDSFFTSFLIDLDPNHLYLLDLFIDFTKFNTCYTSKSIYSTRSQLFFTILERFELIPRDHDKIFYFALSNNFSALSEAFLLFNPKLLVNSSSQLKAFSSLPSMFKSSTPYSFDNELGLSLLIVTYRHISCDEINNIKLHLQRSPESEHVVSVLSLIYNIVELIQNIEYLQVDLEPEKVIELESVKTTTTTNSITTNRKESLVHAFPSPQGFDHMTTFLNRNHFLFIAKILLVRRFGVSFTSTKSLKSFYECPQWPDILAIINFFLINYKDDEGFYHIVK